MQKCNCGMNISNDIGTGECIKCFSLRCEKEFKELLNAFNTQSAIVGQLLVSVIDDNWVNN